jgi:hypothetical protein
MDRVSHNVPVICVVTIVPIDEPGGASKTHPPVPVVSGGDGGVTTTGQSDGSVAQVGSCGG